MKVTDSDSTLPLGVRRQESATRLLVRTVSSHVKGSLRKKDSSSNLDSNGSNHGENNGGSTIERFAEKGKFDEIMALLSHDDHDSVRAWLVQDERRPSSVNNSNEAYQIDDPVVGGGSESSEDDVAEDENGPYLVAPYSRKDRNNNRRVECTTALHLILQHRPPVELVDLLCVKLTQLKGIDIPEDFCDTNGMNPLHLAVANGCDIEVVRRLLNGPAGDLPACSIDHKGRLPLHWACTNVKRPGGLFFTASKKEVDNTVKNAYILIRAFGFAKIYKDMNQHTPMDLAVEHKVDERIIAALHPSRKQLLSTLSGILSNDVSCTGSFRPHIPNELNCVDDEGDDMSSIGMKIAKSSSHHSLTRHKLEDDEDDNDYLNTSFKCSGDNNNSGEDEIKNLEERLADCLAAFDDI